jgi:hypothetical protein
LAQKPYNIQRKCHLIVIFAEKSLFDILQKNIPEWQTELQTSIAYQFSDQSELQIFFENFALVFHDIIEHPLENIMFQQKIRIKTAVCHMNHGLDRVQRGQDIFRIVHFHNLFQKGEKGYLVGRTLVAGFDHHVGHPEHQFVLFIHARLQKFSHGGQLVEFWVFFADFVEEGLDF